jgi:multimeric flavodoxin WrbA
MKVVAFNGSPRKNWNTAQLLEKALEGAASAGAQTEMVNLYDLNYRGCMSCFSCKQKDGVNYAKCAMRDDLTPLLKKAGEADALILGSPLYYMGVTGEMRCFMERLMFPYSAYTKDYTSLFGRKIKTAFIYTMNITEEQFGKSAAKPALAVNEFTMGFLFGSIEILHSFDTYQFADYSKYVSDRFDAAQKAARREEVFPGDLQKAFDMGVRLAN